jgi:hypothetical protein
MFVVKFLRNKLIDGSGADQYFMEVSNFFTNIETPMSPDTTSNFHDRDRHKELLTTGKTQD